MIKLLNIKKYFPGLFVVVFISFIAQVLSPYILIGSVATAIIIGMFFGNIFTIKDSFKSGILFAEKKILNIAIVLMGAQLNAGVLELITYKTVLIIISTIIIAILSARIIGKFFNLSESLSVLIGVGNGICGSSAIASTSSVIDSKENEVGLSIAIINIIGAMGIFLLPSLIVLFGIDSLYHQGVLIGSTIQAVGQVTAAGFIVGDEAGKIAVLIKMVRILMLGPILVLISFLYSKNKESEKTSFIQVPSFILGFIALSAISTAGYLPQDITLQLSSFSKYLLILAMSAIGLNVSFKYILDKGRKVIFVSCITFFIQILFCMILVSKLL